MLNIFYFKLPTTIPSTYLGLASSAVGCMSSDTSSDPVLPISVVITFVYMVVSSGDVSFLPILLFALPFFVSSF